MSFLANYEDVQSRVLRFQKKYPEGGIRVYVEKFEPENGWVMIRAEVRKQSQSSFPDGSDVAFGDRNEYQKNLQKFYVEDTATSAIGRALSQILETDKKPTSQDMSKVVRETAPVPNVEDVWTTVEKPVPQKMDTAAIASQLEAEVVPECKHGAMRLKEGTKNNRAYHGSICPASGTITDVCEPKWYDLSPSGKWVYKPKKG